MGCSASKLHNEDTVRRCKDRRRLIKEALCARHQLAAAHSDYCRSLRIIGSALCSFAADLSLSVSDLTPPVFLHSSNPHISSTDSIPPPVAPCLHPHPQPPSPTVATSKLPHVLSASSLKPTSNRRRNPPKLPHILSESSLPSSPRSLKSNFSGNFHYPTAYQANSTFSSTASQTSSVWNWENFYPPSPPDSEFFDQKAKNQNQNYQHFERHHFDINDVPDEKTERSEDDFFQSENKKHSHHSIHSNTNNKQHNIVYEETEREEVQCSEWGDHDHYSTMSSSEEGEGNDEHKESRSEVGTRSNFRSSAPAGSLKRQPANGNTTKSYEAGSSASFRTEDISDVKTVVRHKDLKDIAEAIKENFDKAAAAGDQVSEMLEISRAQLDLNFRQLKKTVYHSTSMLSKLSSSWTSKPPLAVKYRLDTCSLNEPGGPRSLCSTVERLMAWEKKLSEEVKAREGVKIEHEKKLSTLQTQEYKGENDAKLDRTKASIKRLQSLIIVTSQAVSTTSTAIIGLRDTDLVPQLVELCHGFMYMWKSMHQCHGIQNKIIKQVRGLVNRSAKGDSTSELHKRATRDLESAVSAWHSSFCRLIKFQREFILSVHGWFRLTLLPVSNDNIDGPVEHSDVYAFCDEWKLALDRVPDAVASEAIKSFINVVHLISVKQTEELKIRKRMETATKELEKKASSLRNIERKFYHPYSMVGSGLPDTGHDNGQALDARDPLAEKKSELAACQRRVEDEMLRHVKAVEVTRAMTLNNLQTGLPGVFQALTSFSSLFMESLELVCNRSYIIK